jgi:DNA-binding MarR family transcriptional regulator
MQGFGLTAPQLAALQAVGELQPVPVSGVARSIHLSLATVTGIFNRLETRELVTRSRNGRDRRTVMVELTDGGAELLKAAPSLLQDRFRRELAKLEQWEQTQLLASLQRIASMMDAEEIEAAPVLTPGIVTALPEDVSRYLEEAVKPAEETSRQPQGPSVEADEV